VVIQVDNSDLKLKPGMTANVSIIISTQKNVLKVPNAALRFKIDEKEKKTTEKKAAGGSGLWILQQGRPKRINISAGISDGSYTEITSDTLREGQEVILESILKDQKKQAAPPGPRFF
jgi:HlyD family secretion protein